MPWWAQRTMKALICPWLTTAFGILHISTKVVYTFWGKALEKHVGLQKV